MAMNKNDLADVLKNGLGFGALITSVETIGLAEAIIEEFMLAVVNHVSGSVTGIAPPSGGPLQNGAASGRLILGMTAASLADKMKTKMGKPSITTELLGMASAIVAHALTGVVNFSVITGICGNSTTNPGPLVGEGANGLISGYDGSVLASLMATSMGKGSVSPELLAFCTNMVNYIMTNARVTYLTGSVTGTCPAGGGPITLGTGVGGAIA